MLGYVNICDIFKAIIKFFVELTINCNYALTISYNFIMNTMFMYKCFVVLINDIIILYGNLLFHNA